MKVLKKEISEKNLDGEKMYFVSLPLESTQTHRLIGTTRRMHSSVRTKIHELVQDGVANVKKQVEKMSASDIVKPHPSDRATTRDIYNCIHALLVAGKYSQLDQLQLEMLVKARDTDKPLSDRTKFYFRKSSTESNLRCVLVTCQIKGDVGVSITPKENLCGINVDSDEEESREDDSDVNSIPDKRCSFLFVKPWQQKLLIKYGNILALLDATYKTTKYSLPLFLLCVRTNCGYIPVGEFIVEQERAVSIAEALMILESSTILHDRLQ